jgi:hypothetical protein
MDRKLSCTFLLSLILASAASAQFAITSLQPSSALAGSSGFTLTVNGSGFTTLNRVFWDSTQLTTTFVSATQLTASVTSSLLSSPGVFSVRVRQSLLTATFTNSINFTVLSNPVPIVTSYSPVSLAAASSNATLTVTGSSFIPSTQVRLNGTALAQTASSGSSITATIPAAMRSVGAILNLTVVNPTPGGGTASPGTVTVLNLNPLITNMSPGSIPVGSGSTLVTVVGTGFNADSNVEINGSNMASRY